MTAIDFALSEFQQTLRAAVEKICARFGDDYWLKRDNDGKFPQPELMDTVDRRS